MGRAKDKVSLLEQSESSFNTLFVLVEQLSTELQQKTFDFEGRDRNIRDVFVHLYEWHQLLLTWISNNQQGNQTSFLPKPYNWKTYTAMNVEFWKKHQATSLDDAKILLQQSHRDTIQIVKAFTEDELFVKKYFNWTGSTSLGSYCVSSMSSHYEWAIKIVKSHVKSGSESE